MRHHSFPVWERMATAVREVFWGTVTIAPADRYMSTLARKYMREEYAFSYEKSLFSMKPILKASEIDDSRPTVIRALSEDPVFISVLSGKINTVYDLDPFLD